MTKKTTAANKTAASVANQNLPGSTYESILRDSMDSEKTQEKDILVRIKSTLKGLKGAIETTKDAIDKAEETKQKRLLEKPVKWTGDYSVMEADVELQSLKDGLEWLKKERESMFPNWKNILIED